MNFPTPATHGPIRGVPSTFGSVPGSSCRSRASDSGSSTSPPTSAMTPERSRIVPLPSSMPGFSCPGAPYLSSFIFVLEMHSIRRPAAADVEHGTGGKRVLFGDEPRRQRGELIDLQEASARDLREHPVEVRLRHLLEDAGLGGRRGDAVDRDVLAGQLLAERLRERDHPGL